MLVGYSPLYLCSRRFSCLSRSRLKAAIPPSPTSTNIKNIFVGVLGSEYPIQKIATKQTLEVASSHLTVRLPIFSVNQSMMQRHTILNEKPIIEAISSFGISLTLS